MLADRWVRLECILLQVLIWLSLSISSVKSLLETSSGFQKKTVSNLFAELQARNLLDMFCIVFSTVRLHAHQLGGSDDALASWLKLSCSASGALLASDLKSLPTTLLPNWYMDRSPAKSSLNGAWGAFAADRTGWFRIPFIRVSGIVHVSCWSIAFPRLAKCLFLSGELHDLNKISLLALSWLILMVSVLLEIYRSTRCDLLLS